MAPTNRAMERSRAFPVVDVRRLTGAMRRIDKDFKIILLGIIKGRTLLVRAAPIQGNFGRKKQLQAAPVVVFASF